MVSKKSKSDSKKKLSNSLSDVTIISLGGSLIVPNEIDSTYLREFKKLIERYQKIKRFVLICGGGKTARKYQSAANEVTNLTREDLDWIGVHSTRLNGHLMRTIFKETAFPKVIKDPTQEIKLKTKERIIIAAGWKPGASTDYDAVLLAKNMRAKTIINLTNIDYVYTKDPKTNPDAKPLKAITWKGFRQIVGNKWDPGANWPFDPIASKEAQKLGLRVYIINGNNLNNLDHLLQGEDFMGTIIR